MITRQNLVETKLKHKVSKDHYSESYSQTFVKKTSTGSQISESR